MRLAIITPRYGSQILGGAETLARDLAAQLAAKGHNVHVWTSCARSYDTWANELPAGANTEAGVTVHRFPITHWDQAVHADLSHRLVHEGALPLSDQYRWLAAGAHSVPLYKHVQAQATKFDVILVLPYLSTLAQYAAWVAPERVIFMPCLHDEPYAYLEPVRLLLTAVGGVLFLTPEEQQLARQQLQASIKRQAVLGAAVSAPPSYLPTVNKPDEPYLLCATRLDPAKNLALLYDYAQRYVDEGGRLRLVVLGEGSLQSPAHPVFEHRGFVPEAEKLALAAEALALCHPSLNESFSIVLLESWQMGRPVLVHADCAVTSGHVRRSRGGLTFATFGEFATAVNWFQSQPQQAREMGENGRRYVNQNYTWPIILDRLHQILHSWEKN